MNKQNSMFGRFMLILLVLAMSLSFVGASYAVAPPKGTVCLQITTTGSSDPTKIGQQFTATLQISASGSSYIITGNVIPTGMLHSPSAGPAR